ncbi:hypothetical protein HYDPIDRAFT_28768 [Hydnomerulius pinastri MD-312]|uniref:Transmembrane protein n=1 Tax=Hydnomerulius pinastri MD-312 TaxID=994086 RepID=A0A0C9VFL8_9AGAM|nr:hypothetical protein HYDPIDRAFT_28768 [Hydnomerulius pinastri MD-312]
MSKLHRARNGPLLERESVGGMEVAADATSLSGSAPQEGFHFPASEESIHVRLPVGDEKPISPYSRVLCYLLHGAVLVMHVVLLVLYFEHVEHGLTVAMTPNTSNLNVVLSACLQSAYTIYTAILVYITQSLALWYALSRRQKLTTVHDVSSAWSGLGSAICGLWQQSTLEASSRQLLLVTAYLGSVAVLHISSSTIMQFQAFNATTSALGTLTQAWPPDFEAPAEAWDTLKTVTAVLPAMQRIPNLSKTGLFNSTVYDVFSNITQPGTATVHSNTVTASCGLIANASYTMQTPSSWIINVPMNSTFNYTIISVPPLCNGMIVSLPYQAISLQPGASNETYLGVANPIFLVSASIDMASSVKNDTSLSFQMPSNATLGCYNGANTIAVTTPVYLVGCPLQRLNGTVRTDPLTNTLLEPNLTLGPSESSSNSDWDLLAPLDLLVTSEILNLVGAGLVGADAGGNEVFTKTTPTSGVAPSLIDKYGLFSAETTFINSCKLYYDTYDSNTTSAPSLSRSRMEAAVAQVAAEIIWMGVQYGPSAGGFPSVTLEGQYQQQELKWRLNINLLPLLFATIGSLIMLALSLILTGAFSEQRHRPLTSSASVLEAFWLGARSRSLCDPFESVMRPTDKELRSAGMFDVHLVEKACGDKEWARAELVEDNFFIKEKESLEMLDSP